MRISRIGIVFLILFALFFGCSKSKNPVDENKNAIPVPEGWRLVWNDEFDGKSIDLTKWNFQTGGSGWGNNEWEYYTERDTNAFVEDGKLIIQALKEKYEGRDYTSARMNTSGKGDWTYGRFDIRAKLPFGQGIWPAIWMMPTESVYGGWAASGEIDIMELLGHEPNRVYGTLHYGGKWPDNKHTGSNYTLPQGDFSADFHIYTLEWEPGEMRWYVDGKQYYQLTNASWYTTSALGIGEDAPFDQNFHLILNVAVGGNWPGYPNALTYFPQRMEVDYIRVFEKKE